MIEKVKMESRRYAKRQITWFKKNKEITWLDRSRRYREQFRYYIKIYLKGGINKLATNKKRKTNKKKTNRKNIAKILISSIVIFIIAYIIYKIVSLIAVPTDVYMIENGTISDEESAIRICY